MKNSTIAVSEKVCAYSAAVIADAHATVMRAIRAVQQVGDTRKQAKQWRESVARVHGNNLNSGR